MKITSVKEDPFGQSSSKPDFGPSQGEKSDIFTVKKAKKPPRRKIKKVAGNGGGEGRRRSSRPGTPLLRWKFDEGNSDFDRGSEERPSPETHRKSGRKVKKMVSSRKLGALLWRMQLPEGHTGGGGENLELQSGVANVAAPFHGHHSCKSHISPSKDLAQSPRSVSGPINALLTKVEPSILFPIHVMEGATKWDPISRKKSNDDEEIYIQPKVTDQQGSVAATMSSLESELEQARAHIQELETEHRSSKKKMEHFLRKLSEERAAWRSREHEKIRAIIDDMKSDLTRERKNRQRLEIVNSKLVNELTDTKLSAKRYMQEYEKERRSRELIEEVCDELAKEISEDKAEIEELKRESMRFQEEVDEERKMLQMAEVWREERVQMKLLDAKVILEDKFSQMNKLVADLESILTSSGSAPSTEDVKKAEMLRQVATNMSIQEIRDFTYEKQNPDDMFSLFEDVNFCEPPSSERQTVPCIADSNTMRGSQNKNVSPEANGFNRYNAQSHPSYVYQSGELEDGSEWETVSQLDDRGSSSPGVTNPSFNPSGRASNVSGSGSEWDGDKREACTIPNRQLKKVSSISRLWKSSNGENYKIISLEGFNGRLSNGRLSNGVVHSPDHGSGKEGSSPQGLSGQQSSPDSANPHIYRGMKGCIEWPRSGQKNSLKNKLLEARMEREKIQLRQVLKQKI
ncbi:hypothetical protein LIER_00417 [Lithospermum erythrorhizon]|uniref:Uncharacterized protein n=1 Tax=Lithospermum erythrorhizon TaxID=34254 RepID=A0AAV3NJR6_LITER